MPQQRFIYTVDQRVETMNPEQETRKQAFERMRREYRSQMTEIDAIQIFDNTPNWLPDHLLAKLPPERLESMSTEKPVLPDAPQTEEYSPLAELLHFLAYLSINKNGFAAALRFVYLPQEKPNPAKFNRHRFARFLMLNAELEQVLIEHQLPPVLLAKIIQCGFANPYEIDKDKEVDFKEEFANEPFSALVDVITTFYGNTKTLDRIYPLLEDAKAAELADKKSRFRTFFFQKYREIGKLNEPGAPAQDNWFEAVEKSCGFSLTQQERIDYAAGQVQALDFSAAPVFSDSTHSGILLSLQKRISAWCALPEVKPEQPVQQTQAQNQTPTHDTRLENTEKKLNPYFSTPANTTTPPNNTTANTTANTTTPPPKQQPETQADEKPGFWKRIWNWLGTNWDKVLLGLLVIGGLLWMVWKQFFAPKKAKTSYGEQDQPAARKKRSGSIGEDYAMS
jgi:hypothetical protein